MPRWRRLLPPLLIVLAAIGYYGSYLNFWFNPHDEGGTAALIAKRLLEGEVPIRDVELGYNVLWFWPIVGLFKLAGVNFLLMRAYFFALSALTALCGWLLVRRVTRNEWLALAVGLALVVFPGSQFKNYIPLLCVANTLCLVNAALAARQSVSFWWRSALGGLALGLTLLIRIDIGFLFMLMWTGLLLLRLFQVQLSARARWIDTATAAAVLAAGLVVTHTPVYLIARAQGFGDLFLQQYTRTLTDIGQRAGVVTRAEPPRLRRADTRDPNRSLRAAQQPLAHPVAPPITLPRVDPGIFRPGADAEWDKRVLFLLTYAPLLVYAVLIAWAAFTALRALPRKEFAVDHPGTLALLLLGGSLATFPQFFFFRPDRPHLSEFMPGYVVATVCVAVLLGVAGARRFRWAVAAFLAVQFGLFGWFAMDHYSAGTIAARINIKRNKREFFDGDNGVRVWVHKREHAQLEGVRRLIVANSRPDEWVICYPYQPGYNLMTNRRTYERDLYIDNATAPRGWARRAVARIEDHRPAVVVLDTRAINKVEVSRFTHWAKPVSDYVRQHYHLAGKFAASEVYTRDPAAPTLNP